MKWFSIIFILLITLFFVTNVKASNNLNKDINSLELISYLKQNNKLNKVKYICTNNYCSKEMYGNREKEIKIFINNYISNIKNKSFEDGIRLELKGFKITKIVFNDF